MLNSTGHSGEKWSRPALENDYYIFSNTLILNHEHTCLLSVGKRSSRSLRWWYHVDSNRAIGVEVEGYSEPFRTDNKV